MTITYEDFEKVDIRVGKILEVSDFPEAKKPAFKFTIDFGQEIGTKEELRGMLVCCVINFPPKRVASFDSEVLTLGFKNATDIGWVLITPAKDSVALGSKLA